LIGESFQRGCDFLRDIKSEIEQNEKLRYDYGNLVSSKNWSKTSILTKTGTLISVFAKTSVRGAKFKEYRPDYIIIDDLENEAVLNSKAIDNLKSWFNKSVMHLGDFDSRYIINGTLISRKSLLIDLMKDPTWTTLFFKAVMKYADREDLWNRWVKIVTNKNNPDRLIEGRLFYEKNKEEMLKGVDVFWDGNPLYDYYELMIQRYVSPGLFAFESEKQNNPMINYSPQSINPNDIGYYDELPKDMPLFLGVDPSLGKDDFTGMVIIGTDEFGYTYVLDAENILTEDPNELADIIIQKDKSLNFTAIGIESVGFQRWLNKIIEHKDQNTALKIFESYNPSIPGIQNQKQRKISSLKMIMHKIKFNRTLQVLIEQLYEFPNGEHDDLLDALMIAMDISSKYLPLKII